MTVDIDPRNEASRACLIRLGVITGRKERTFEIEGMWIDSLDLKLGKGRFVEPKA